MDINPLIYNKSTYIQRYNPHICISLILEKFPVRLTEKFVETDNTMHKIRFFHL